MSNAAAGLPIFADHSPQIFSLLAAVFIVGACLAGILLVLLVFFRELSSACALRDRQCPDLDFFVPRKPAARETSPYWRGQFQGRRNRFA
jgi:hypothetical protein